MFGMQYNVFELQIKDNYYNVNFEGSFINCLDCRNEWLIRDVKEKQVLNAKCMMIVWHCTILKLNHFLNQFVLRKI